MISNKAMRSDLKCKHPFHGEERVLVSDGALFGLGLRIKDTVPRWNWHLYYLYMSKNMVERCSVCTSNLAISTENLIGCWSTLIAFHKKDGAMGYTGFPENTGKGCE